MIEEYFKARHINLRAFARANELDYDTFFRVLKGRLQGQKKTKGKTKKVFEKLFELGIIDEMPKGFKEHK